MGMKALLRKKTIAQVNAQAASNDAAGGSLKRVLGVRDLTVLGVAAVIGAGIFSSIGKAAYDGGPGIVFLYIFTAIACGFAAMCYAEFASRVPVAGSAYTDRKSTRLNSSHVRISYAVFCLKKKK